MTILAEKTYTPEELLGSPLLEGHELIEGHLRERAMSKRSSQIGVEITRLLANEAKRTREADVYGCDLGYRCFLDSPNTLRFPDASVLRKSEANKIEGDPGYMPIPADLVVEVLSPNDVIREVDDKVDEYLDAGFGLVWVVNPRRRDVHVYRRDASAELLQAEDQITGGDALPSFRCKVADFFDV
jgi:Uma2 family endonuclease